MQTPSDNINLGDINPLTNPQPLINLQDMIANCETSAFFGPSSDADGYIYYADTCIGISSTSSTDYASRKLYLQREDGSTDVTKSVDFILYNRLVPSNTTILGTGAAGQGKPYSLRVTDLGAAGNTRPDGVTRIPIQGPLRIGMQLSPSQQAQLPVGTYKNTFTFFSWSGAAFTSGSVTEPPRPSSTAGCSDYSGGSTKSQVFTVVARVLAGCTVSTTSINFGEHLAIDNDLSQDGAVTLKCNVNAPYEIQIDGGKSGDVNARKMYFVGENGIEDRSKAIPYHIYLPNTQTEWGTTEGSTYKGITSANETPIKVKAVIRASEVGERVVGTYKDRLTVTTTY
ncbi:spore coat U domain-containing protein [Bartonella sp. HY406]|uniref:Csu type fimbrial protein n=1 Tax=Bartonella sp. HY406 TaxID=2979331 RepID=UPI0021C7EE0E|nr:spore coat protein U domain-containing protein [Bartonella sp. HY406]UXN05086.1 spore coat protein U domain-containing protein [Bartonella sp. HY406]